MEILPSARKHGVSDDDIRNAVNNAVAAITTQVHPDFTMLIGPDTAARLVEVGVLAAEDNDYVIPCDARTKQVSNHDQATR